LKDLHCRFLSLQLGDVRFPNPLLEDQVGVLHCLILQLVDDHFLNLLGDVHFLNLLGDVHFLNLQLEDVHFPSHLLEDLHCLSLQLVDDHFLNLQLEGVHFRIQKSMVLLFHQRRCQPLL
jgi:hypothetical protein